jgi:hypothetical protein
MAPIIQNPDGPLEGGQPHDAARRRKWRPLWVSLGDLFANLGLAYLEIGQRLRRPGMARRAGGILVKAVAYYLEAGLGRKAAAINRLIDRSRRAWLRHEAAEGFA